MPKQKAPAIAGGGEGLRKLNRGEATEQKLPNAQN
jgi:hypothetical protein